MIYLKKSTICNPTFAAQTVWFWDKEIKKGSHWKFTCNNWLKGLEAVTKIYVKKNHFLAKAKTNTVCNDSRSNPSVERLGWKFEKKGRKGLDIRTDNGWQKRPRTGAIQETMTDGIRGVGGQWVFDWFSQPVLRSSLTTTFLQAPSHDEQSLYRIDARGTGPFVCPFGPTSHSIGCSTLLASLALSTALTRHLHCPHSPPGHIQ